MCNGHTSDNHFDQTDSYSSDNDAVEHDVGENDEIGSSSPTPNIQHCSFDPVRNEAPDLQVKIADLGNACWVVSHVKRL